MKCISCDQEAVVHYAEVIDGEIKKLDLCEDCAVKKGFGVEPSISIGDLLGGLTEKSIKSKSSLKCPFCELTFEAFKKEGRLGCDECYVTFNDSLIPMIEQIHKSTQHHGKVPLPCLDDSQRRIQVSQMEVELQKAIEQEDFEKAAFLRDEIKNLKSHVIHEN